MFARALQHPTRSVFGGVSPSSLLICPCSHWGLPRRTCYQIRGELLPHPFTLTASFETAVCFLLRCPSVVLRPPPRRYLAVHSMEPGLSSGRQARDHPAGSLLLQAIYRARGLPEYRR